MKCVLRDLIEYSKDGEWGKDQQFDESEEMLCVRGTDFESARFGSTEKVPRRFIAQRHADRKRLQPWDVLIEAAGGTKDQPTGRTVLLKPSVFRRASHPLTCASFSRLIRFNTELCDPAFMFWYLQSLYHSDIMRAYHTQHTGVARFQWTVFAENEPLQIPDLPTQRKIAGVLSTYDDLIENNLRRIKILEQMAQSLYREWFAHFRFPGHESARFIDSPLGQIPEGWEAGRLEDVLVLQRGFDLPKAEREAGDVPIYAASGITGHHSESKVKGPGIVTGRSGTIGQVLYVHEDFWPLNTALWVKAFPKSEPLYAYFVLSSIDLKGFNSGAAVPTLNRNDVHGLDTLIPPIGLQRRFQEIAGAMLSQSRTLTLSIQSLRRTRDLMLPKLLSAQ
jgi:type I restriction enzyme S subunit